ncbi:hypothetical protein [Dyella subtropica]|uniref:hypothetical protein n=1 Tax=Dyella subtropica TaxID=2992127 RepID=UPI00225956D4|nr:hypothetical protein [Dyella subtropica]
MPQATIDLDRDEVLLGDLNNFTGLKSIQNPSQDQVRLHAAAVRRLLLEGHLAQSCSSRSIKLAFLVPDALPLVRDARKGHVPIFQLAGLEVFGLMIAGLMTHKGPPRGHQAGFDPGHRVELECGSFLKQVVAGAAGEMITRHDVIIYVANKVGGVHFDPKPTNKLPEAKLHALGVFRNSVRMGLVNGMPTVNFNHTALEDQASKFRYEPAFIDAAYLEFLACIQFIIDSPAVLVLKEAIEVDLHGA